MNSYSMYTGDSAEDIICRTLLHMMEQQPYYQIKVTDLVKCAGISRSTFYVYFDSIYTVLQKLEDDYLSIFPAENLTAKVACIRLSKNDCKVAPDVIETTRQLTEHIRIYRILSGMNGESYFQIRIRNRFMRICQQVLDVEISNSTDERKQIISLFFAGGRIAVMDWWMHHADSMSCEELAAALTELYTKLFNLTINEEKKVFANNILFSFPTNPSAKKIKERAQ